MRIPYAQLQQNAAASGNWFAGNPAIDREFQEARADIESFLTLFGQQASRETIEVEWSTGKILTAADFASPEAIGEWFTGSSGFVDETQVIHAEAIWRKAFDKAHPGEEPPPVEPKEPPNA